MTKEEMQEQCKICKRVTRRKYHVVIAWAIIVTIALAVILTLYLVEGNIGCTTVECDVAIQDNTGNVEDVIVGDNNTQAKGNIQGSITEQNNTDIVLIICGTCILVSIFIGGAILYVGKDRVHS